MTRAEAARLVPIHVLFCVGAALAFVFLDSVGPAIAVPIAAIVATGAYAVRALARHASRWRRVAGYAGWTVTVLVHALWLYLAAVWGALLAWTVPWWGLAVVGLATAAAIGTKRWKIRGVEVPLALPLGLWIVLVLRGWMVEESRVQCDDWIAARDTPGVTLVVPTLRELADCTPGSVVEIGRYPRVIWEYPDGDGWLVTTQAANSSVEPRDARFTGSVCKASEGAEPICVGAGKAQGITDAPELDRVFIGTWGGIAPGFRGEVVSVPRSGAPEVLSSVRTRNTIGELFYVPDADRLYGFTDDGGRVVQLAASTLSFGPPIPMPILPPGRVSYDSREGEGVLCVASGPALELDGEPYLSIAIRGEPFDFRPIGTSALARLSLTWGCGWDPQARRVYVAIPNLGLITTIDFDTGDVLRSDFVGVGIRGVTVDRRRGRLYAANFLRGEIVAIDIPTMDVVRTWNVGRFTRFATISGDGRWLWVGSNLGIVAIDLSRRARDGD